ncbi:MAG: hypothetical protein P1U61_00120 [Legionellaceae bacterium]|nr:hypothetical protein [Legionellaceae bacterium]
MSDSKWCLFFERVYQNETDDVSRQHDGAYQAWLAWKATQETLTPPAVIQGGRKIATQFCVQDEQGTHPFCKHLDIILKYAVWAQKSERNQAQFSSSSSSSVPGCP